MKQIHEVLRVGFEPRTSGLEVLHPNHSATLPSQYFGWDLLPHICLFVILSHLFHLQVSSCEFGSYVKVHFSLLYLLSAVAFDHLTHSLLKCACSVQLSKGQLLSWAPLFKAGLSYSRLVSIFNPVL